MTLGDIQNTDANNNKKNYVVSVAVSTFRPVFIIRFLNFFYTTLFFLVSCACFVLHMSVACALRTPKNKLNRHGSGYFDVLTLALLPTDSYSHNPKKFRNCIFFIDRNMNSVSFLFGFLYLFQLVLFKAFLSVCQYVSLLTDFFNKTMWWTISNLWEISYQLFK